MAVELVLAYSKKLGLPEYSSHSLSVSLTTEVQQLDQVDAEVERVYRLLQRSVDQQIVDSGFVPGNGDGGGQSTEQPAQWKCSDRQRALILQLVSENDLDRREIDELATARFGHGVTSLNRLEASGLIDEIFERYRGNGNGGGRQSRSRSAQRRAA